MDFSHIKGTLRGWTEKSVKWYEDASEYTGYHDFLREHLLRFLNPDDRCCEIACGTGILARKIFPHVLSYTANDADASAMAFLRSRIAAQGLDRLEVVEGEWQTALKGRSFDVVITSYYGLPVKLWPELCLLARRQFIAICPRNEQWRKSRQKREEPDEQRDIEQKLETPGQIKRFFEEKGIPYQSLPLDLEFGQPFNSREEAEEYVHYYYKLDDREMTPFIEEKTVAEDGKLYFPKKKEIEMIAGDLSAVR